MQKIYLPANARWNLEEFSGIWQKSNLLVEKFEGHSVNIWYTKEV